MTCINRNLTSTITVDSVINSMLQAFDDYEEYWIDYYSVPIPYISESDQSLIDDTNTIIKRFSRDNNSNLNPLALRIKTAIQKLALKTDPLDISFMGYDLIRNIINKLSSPDISQIDQFKYFFDLILFIIDHDIETNFEIQTINKLISRLDAKMRKKLIIP